MGRQLNPQNHHSTPLRQSRTAGEGVSQSSLNDLTSGSAGHPTEPGSDDLQIYQAIKSDGQRAQIPDNVRLVKEMESTERHCTVVWRRKTQIGVKFA